MATLELNEAACTELAAMARRVQELAGAVYTAGFEADSFEAGEAAMAEASEAHAEAAKSFVNAMLNLAITGGKITRDGELSLYGASYIHYGIIWHPRYENGKREDSDLRGSWSFHS